MRQTRVMVGGMLVAVAMGTTMAITFAQQPQAAAVKSAVPAAAALPTAMQVPTGPSPVLPDVPYNYASLNLPSHFANGGAGGRAGRGGGRGGRGGGRGGRGGPASPISQDNTPQNNPVTNEGATLGRVLFYETQLSANKTLSCGSCHLQEFGFSDTARVSRGFDGGTTRRHSMSLSNARYYSHGAFFWDERAASLEEQVLMPLQDKVEMGMTLSGVVQAVSEQSYYPPLFTAAFGDSSITSDRIARALAQYVRSIVSASSRYDSARVRANNIRADFAGLSAQENFGKSLFLNPGRGRTPCADCHAGEAFIAESPRGGRGGNSGATNNGLDFSNAADRGVAEATGNRRDTGRFKVPSLRNIEVTAPYMHDGRFATLEEVIEHYSSGIKAGPNLDPSLRGQNGAARLYNFNAAEKAALVAFLRTLTDRALLTDVKFSDPFRR